MEAIYFLSSRLHPLRTLPLRALRSVLWRARTAFKRLASRHSKAGHLKGDSHLTAQAAPPNSNRAFARERANAAGQKQLVTLLKQELQKIPRYRYGSYLPGRDEWERRWDASPGRRILFFADKDYSGSFFKWVDAVNRYTDFAARLVVQRTHQYSYENDLIIPFSGVFAEDSFIEIAREADIIHIKDEKGFYSGSNKMPLRVLDTLGKPTVFTAYGGYMRKLENDVEFRKHLATFAARIAMTPDLNYDWFDGHFIPHAIDARAYPYQWQDGNVLAHSPSTKARKGTSELVEAVQGLNWEFDMIHGVSHAECMARKQHANLFFDQAGAEIEDKLGISTVIGWYGNSALEAAVFGIPTIAHLSSHAFEGARRAGRDIEQRCGIVNTPLGAQGIRLTLKRIAEMSSEERRQLSLDTRRWIEEFHSYEMCAQELCKVYTEILTIGKSSPALAH